MERTIEEWIFSYPDASPAEQQSIEAYVATHPELEPLLEDAKAYSALLKQAGRMDSDAPDDEVLAYYVVVQQVYGAVLPDHLRAPFRRIEEVLRKRRDLREQVERYAARIQEVERHTDAVAHFERLAGYNQVASGTLAKRIHRGPVETNRRRFLGRYTRVGAAALLLAGMMYGALFLISRSLQPEAEQLAWFDAETLSTEGYRVTTRSTGATHSVTTSDALFIQALGILREAQASTLGLFPRFDTGKLVTAERLLEHVARDPASGPFLRAEAAFYLGKVRLGLGDVLGARDALETAVKGEALHAGNARQLLSHLDARQTP